MKIIKPSVEFLGEVPTDCDNALKFIEAAGRTCYKSEDKITDTSAGPFVKRLIKAGHLAMVEHSNFVVRKPFDIYFDYMDQLESSAGKYLSVILSAGYLYIGGNLTAWYQRTIETGMISVMEPFMDQYVGIFPHSRPENLGPWRVCPHDEIPKELHRYSARFICDRGISHELVRHRPCSFAQESTRYVNYDGKDVEFIEPAGFEEWAECLKAVFLNRCSESEQGYKILIEGGLKPQQARAILPNALKTEIVVTADAAEWQHIRNLRNAAPPAHPDMARVMNMMPWEEMGL